jgi:hypothetical protein
MFCKVLLSPSIGQPKTNIYTALQNENGVCLSITENKRQMTMPYGGRNPKWQSLQAGILKDCDE